MNKYAICCNSLEDEQLLKDWIKKEFNSDKYNSVNFTGYSTIGENWKFAFPNLKDFNGFNNSNHLILDSEIRRTHITKINIKDFLKEYNKNMKTELLGLPIINGEKYHLEAFGKDCEKFGYNIHFSTFGIFSAMKLNGVSEDTCLKRESSFKTLYIGNSKSYNDTDLLSIKEFQLPQDWSKALDFMKENMDRWNKIQEENKKPEFKVGDIVVCLDTQKTRNGNKDEMYKIIALSSEKDWVYIDVASTIDISRLRFATPQEIEEYNNKPKIFKMTSSSGDFELEVSKKGIYYRPEQKWLSTDFLWEFTNKGCMLPITPGIGYKVCVTKVDVGCKKDCLVSQFQEVYNYYKSLQ